jgi:hypothetical protein
LHHHTIIPACNTMRDEGDKMRQGRQIFANARRWLAERFWSSHSEREANPPREIVIEFMGGPLDGHRETTSQSSFARLPNCIEVPISRSQFDLLDGAEPSNFAVATSIAIYDLVRVGEHWRLQIRCQISASQRNDQPQA